MEAARDPLTGSNSGQLIKHRWSSAQKFNSGARSFAAFRYSRCQGQPPLKTGIRYAVSGWLQDSGAVTGNDSASLALSMSRSVAPNASASVLKRSSPDPAFACHCAGRLT